MKKLFLFLMLILSPVCGWAAEGDYIGVAFNLENGNPCGICTDNTYFYVTNHGYQVNPTVDVYTVLGVYQSSWDLPVDSDPKGLTYDGTYLYIINTAGDDSIMVYTTAGEYQSSFNLSTSGCADATDIEYLGGILLITDYVDNKVYQFSTSGVLQGSVSLSGHGRYTNYYGITFYDNYFYIADIADNEVEKYNGSFEYQSYFNISSSASGHMCIYDKVFYMVDSTADSVLMYATAAPTYYTSSISDDFNDNEINTALWTGVYETNGTATEQNNQIEFVASGSGEGWAQINTATVYTFDSVVAELIDVPTTGAATYFGLVTNDGYRADISVYYDAVLEKLRCQFSCYDTGYEQYLETIDYSAVNHKYFKITEIAGVLYYYTSPNGTVWTQQWSYDHSIDFETELVTVYMGLYSEIEADFAAWDNFNILPKVPYVFNNAILNNVTIE